MLFRSCQVGELTCGDGQCIPAEWQCDQEPDCADQSDESGCAGTASGGGGSCQAGEFACNSGECIPGDWECDGILDCSDASDELGATCN